MTLSIFTIENDKIINIIYSVMRLKLNNYVKLPRIVNGIQGNISLVSFFNRSMKIFTKTSIQYSMKTLVESRRHSVICCSSEHKWFLSVPLCSDELHSLDAGFNLP